MQRYFHVLGFLAATLLPLSGCGDQGSEPGAANQAPTLEQEAPDTPVEGQDDGMTGSRSLGIFPDGLVAFSLGGPGAPGLS